MLIALSFLREIQEFYMQSIRTFLEIREPMRGLGSSKMHKDKHNEIKNDKGLRDRSQHCRLCRMYAHPRSSRIARRCLTMCPLDL